MAAMTTKHTPVTPECSKWAAAQPTLATLRDFLDWCEQQGIELGTWRTSSRYLQPVGDGREAMLARYLEIDTRKLENERRALLRSLGEDA